MESGEQFRRWDEMIPDALGLIFSKLSLEEILTIIPCVCWPWNRVVSGPYCWEVIDLDDWCDQLREPEFVLRMLHMLISRSNGIFRELRVRHIDDLLFLYIAHNASSLQILQVRWSEISDSAVEQAATMFSSLIVLDLSFCNDIGARAIEAFDKSCPSLSVFRRAMSSSAFNMSSQDEEAQAIAAWMPNLRVLVMINAIISDDSVLEILSCCRNLEYLNFSGCYNLNLKEELYWEKLPCLKRVTLSATNDDYEDDCNADHDIDSMFDPGSPSWD